MAIVTETTGDKLRILFIEDDQSVAEALKNLITKKMSDQVETFFATTLAGGVKLSNEIFPCIVFLDLLFPGSTWQDSAHAIRDIHGVVIVVTELDDIGIELECRGNGALMVFNKSKIPSIIDVLVHVIANIRLNAIARTVVRT